MGYINYSRSVNSQYAIDNYEIPLSQINKDLIERFLEKEKKHFEDIYLFLKTLKINKWKALAEDMGATSWHHTSKYYNETDHYDLFQLIEEIRENKEEIEKDIENAKKETAEKRKIRKVKTPPIILEKTYCIAEIQNWGGTRRRPEKFITYEIGLKKDRWLHTYNKSKYDLFANKTLKYTSGKSLEELAVKYPTIATKDQEIKMEKIYDRISA